ncbi:interleukin-1 receptor-associated kinase 1-binding protein 1 isoform X2 [Octodon degus]|uniref:Interleukin-1 receptor-associated kinase 1-binding protein 1 isoform X2 n=1 Tax=Octodon degus TaxID=10160 RepID=A0A6P3EY88_OCTDE|nr:interleukin-1 receptor-associated kinase 1-binding protein 1 isoform X2 [Octodon degus]
MSLPLAPPSRVFVELVPWADGGREQGLVAGGEALPAARRALSAAAAHTGPREVHVCGSAAVSARPDRAQVVVRVSSTKEAAAEAQRSVVRRLDYVAQSLRQRGVQEENIIVTKDFRRVENAYHMEAEVCITFTEFGKMQNICNFLVEKLDSSVVVSPPQFYHAAGAVENLRRQACLAAVQNAWRKAQDVCSLVGQTLGKPLLIKEEETKDWEGHPEDCQPPKLSGSLTVQEKIKSTTIHATSKVFTTFEVKGKEKRKKYL